MRSWRVKDRLAAHWPLQNAVGGVTPDVSGHGYHGTLVNAPTWGVGPFGGLQCIELDGGTQHVNVGDVTQLNAVEQFTIAFWMVQNVLDVADIIFRKVLDGTNRILLTTEIGGNLRFNLYTSGVSRATFDYSTVVSAQNWHHLAYVFDGSQTGDANRLIAYVDGRPITLAFNVAMPAATADLAGIDATIGYFATSLDGRLWDMRLLTVAATRDEINQIIHSPVPYLV